MNCPACGISDSRVRRTHCYRGRLIVRSRDCTECGARWETEEEIVKGSLMTLDAQGTAISRTPALQGSHTPTVPVCQGTQLGALPLASPSDPSLDLFSASGSGARDPNATGGAPESPPLLEFPVVGKVKTWGLGQALFDEIKAAFPSLDVMGECRKARAWVLVSPRNKKTGQGMGKFLFSWMGRVQDRGPARTEARRDSPLKPATAPSSYCLWHQDALRYRLPANKPLATCPACKHLAAASQKRAGEPQSLLDVEAGRG